MQKTMSGTHIYIRTRTHTTQSITHQFVDTKILELFVVEHSRASCPQILACTEAIVRARGNIA